MPAAAVAGLAVPVAAGLPVTVAAVVGLAVPVAAGLAVPVAVAAGLPAAVLVAAGLLVAGADVLVVLAGKGFVVTPLADEPGLAA